MNTPTPTPRTDLLTAKHWGDGFAAKYLKPLMQAMERELTAVTEQRDGLRSGIDYASDQLTRVTEQRDRLAEAVKQYLPYVPDMRPIGAARHSDANVKAWALRDALQSLTTKDHE
jgi:hypothetical protein